MDSQKPDSELYRLQFRDYLRERSKSEAPNKPARNDRLLIADMLLTERPDLTRMLQTKELLPDSSLQDNDSDLSDNSIETSDGSIYRSTFDSYGFSSAQTRKSLEDAVRKIKRLRQPCPHCTADRLCGRTFIRCGERAQYSTRETQRQRMLPHRCNYDPSIGATHAIIAGLSNSDTQRVISIASDVLGMSNSRILAASTGREAIDIVNLCKIDMRRCGLIVTAMALADMTGFELVNELYIRNCDTNIILVQQGSAGLAIKPLGYSGDLDIAPGEPLVRDTIISPIEPYRLGNVLRTLHTKAII